MWSGKRQLAVALAATGLVSFGAAVVFAVQARDFRDDAHQLCPSDPCGSADEANVLLNRADTRGTYAGIAVGAGAALVLGAGVLWYLGSPDEPSSSSSAFAPHVSPAFTGIAYSTRF